MSGAVSRRYARALFALAKEGKVLEQTAEQLARVAAVAADPAVAPLLRSPLLSVARRSELAHTLARELGLADLMPRFLRLLADQQRLGELPMIADGFQRLLDAERHRVRVTIRTALTLDARQQADIVAAFADVTGKEVLPHVVVEPDLLGGVVVEVEGKVYDGSVRTHLARLAKDLSGAHSL